MIIVADTGILVRATSRSFGPARVLVQQITADPAHILATSPFILGEVGKVLCYPQMQRLFNLTPDEIHEHVAFLRRSSRVVEPGIGMPVVLSDPKDDPVVYTAIAAGADVLCTRDADFSAPNVIAFCRRYNIKVMDDLQLLARLAG